MYQQNLKDFALFDGFTRQEVEQVTAVFEPCWFPHDSVIIEQGQPTDYLYILSSGKVIIRYKPYDGPPFTFATIDPGDVFGWSMALGRPVYTSEAVAEADCQAYRLSKERLIQMSDRCPEVVAVLMRRLVDRIIPRAQSAQGEILNILIEGIDRNGNYIRRLKNGKRRT